MHICLTSSLDDSAEGTSSMLVHRWCPGASVCTECSCLGYVQVRISRMQGQQQLRARIHKRTKPSAAHASAHGGNLGLLTSPAFCFLQLTSKEMPGSQPGFKQPKGKGSYLYIPRHCLLAQATNRNSI